MGGADDIVFRTKNWDVLLEHNFKFVKDKAKKLLRFLGFGKKEEDMTEEELNEQKTEQMLDEQKDETRRIKLEKGINYLKVTKDKVNFTTIIIVQ